MSGCLSLRQAQKKLQHAAPWFCEDVTIALDYWQSTSQVLQGYPQYPSTEATSRIVDAAMLDHSRQKMHPPGGTRTPQKPQDQRAWVEKHLPGISKAMLECTRRQLDISTKRINILQSLLKSGWQPDSTQFVAQLQSERTACIYVEQQWWVLCLILPVAVLCGGVAWLNNPSRDASWCIDLKAMQHYLNRCSSTYELVREAPHVVAVNLNQVTALRAQLSYQVQHIRQCLGEMGLGVFKDHRFHQAKLVSSFLLCNADIQWLHLASQLLPVCEWAVLFLQVMCWPSLGSECIVRAHMYGRARSYACCVLAHPGVLPALTRAHKLRFLARMLHGLKVQAEHMQAAGVPEAIQQQLLSLMEDVPSSSGSGVQQQPEACGNLLCTNQHASTSRSIADCSQGVKGNRNSGGSDSADCEGSAAASNTESGVTGAHDGSWNDMNALLQMMYGCSM